MKWFICIVILFKKNVIQIQNLVIFLIEGDVPAWYVENMKKILYLFPKTHLIALLKRDICKFLVMDC